MNEHQKKKTIEHKGKHNGNTKNTKQKHKKKWMKKGRNIIFSCGAFLGDNTWKL